VGGCVTLNRSADIACAIASLNGPRKTIDVSHTWSGDVVLGSTVRVISLTSGILGGIIITNGSLVIGCVALSACVAAIDVPDGHLKHFYQLLFADPTISVGIESPSQIIQCFRADVFSDTLEEPVEEKDALTLVE